MSLIGYGILLYASKYMWCELVNVVAKLNQKSQQHPKDFPGGHPPQYYPGLARLNFGVQKGSGAFDAVWPLTR